MAKVIQTVHLKNEGQIVQSERRQVVAAAEDVRVAEEDSEAEVAVEVEVEAEVAAAAVVGEAEVVVAAAVVDNRSSKKEPQRHKGD